MQASSTIQMRGAAFIAVALLALPVSGRAATLFVPPSGCTLDMTVQERSCAVAQHFRCAGDPPGDRHIAYFEAGGVATFESVIDAETRWLQSRDPQSGIEDVLEDGAQDDASLTALMATGEDAFDFWTVSNDGERLHHKGRDVLTGETQVIDGEPLEKTTFMLETSNADGQILITRQGNQFISRARRLFFGGVERQTDWTGATESVNRTPVTFSRPGTPGFGTTEPRYDCEVLTAGLSARGGA